MLVNVKIIKGEEISVNVSENATVAELKEEISNFLSHPVSQIKVLKPSGGVLPASSLVTDIYSHPTPLKVILGVDTDHISIKTKLLNSSSEHSLSFPSNTLLTTFKEKVSYMHGIDKSVLSFLHNGLALTKDNLTLKVLNIRNGATIMLKQKKPAKDLSLNICAANGLHFQLSLSAATTLSELRKIISSKLQTNVDNIHIRKSEISLTDDNKNLRDYEIEDGHNIHVFLDNDYPNGTVSATTSSEVLTDINIRAKSPNDLEHPFFTEMDNILTKHIPDERERVRVMEHFCQHTTAYVNSLNLEDIEEMTPDRNLTN
ncbi:hypothetical protein LOD99_2489 [Oopsacas minuta]|uniref:Ubiquitin-like domain-containing protein n=1 Tax=Oopsacas minuta TaxID=111878 RepID=A0AAV7K2R1_9METZ|nr:hypothetical protein LOD99_2489 [Oopsacas minuta]